MPQHHLSTSQHTPPTFIRSFSITTSNRDKVFTVGEPQFRNNVLPYWIQIWKTLPLKQQITPISFEVPFIVLYFFPKSHKGSLVCGISSGSWDASKTASNMQSIMSLVALHIISKTPIKLHLILNVWVWRVLLLCFYRSQIMGYLRARG